MGTQRIQSTALYVAALVLATAMANPATTGAGIGGFEPSAPISLAESSNITDMLTPHGADEPLEALAMLRQLLVQQLSVPDWQLPVMLITLSIGVLMLWSPSGVFKNVIVVVVFCIAYIMMLGDLHERYDVEHHESGSSLSNGVAIWEVILSLEVAVCASVIAWRGYDGILMVIGMTIGLWPMRFVQTTLVSLGIFGASPWWNIIIITASGSLGLYLNQKDDHILERYIGYVLPVFGGRLVASSVGWLVLVLCTGNMDQVWLDFWKSLPLDIYDPAEQHVQQALAGAPGIGWSSPESIVPAWAGWAAGSLIWLILSVAAVVHHHRALLLLVNMTDKQRKEEEEKGDLLARFLSDKEGGP